MKGEKKRMKKALAILFALALLVGCRAKTEPVATNTPATAAPSQETVAPAESVDEPEAEVEAAPVEEKDWEEMTRDELIAKASALPAASGSIVRGSTTDVDVYMLNGWTNSSSNADIKELIHGGLGGYSTIVWTQDGRFIVNPISVEEFTTADNADGSKTFTFKIYKDLVYNDGTAISAKDYVFTNLLGFSSEFQELEGFNTGAEMYPGGEEYSAGESNRLPGFRLIDDYTFSVTLVAEELPNHYELASTAVGPLPLQVIAPGCDVKDDGVGTYIDGPWSVDLIRETLLNEQTGYAYNPKVTSGAYQFDSYDLSTKTAILSANPKFLSTHDGYKPQIEKIILKKTVSATQLEELEAGEVDLLDGNATGSEIEKGLTLVDNGKADYFNYPRNGFGHITFKCDIGPTQFAEVRKALIYSLDREEFAMLFAKGYAEVVDGYYGLSSPEYQYSKDEMESLITHYTYNLEKAEESLVSGGWTLGEDGSAYTSGVRYKKLDDGTLMPLIIEWLSSENNEVSDHITTLLLPAAESIGIKINKTQVDFATLLTHLYRDGVEPFYHMFNLAVGFTEANEYWYVFSSEEEYLDQWNSTNIIDEELESTAKGMKSIPADDWESWVDSWVKMQVRWNELVPMIPLYSNDYHDFFNLKLKGYDVSPTWDWAHSIIRCYIG
ncbi:MAG: ABC transporter substrate-binding protein [Clostridiales bacterium]|nr:ABC transporter substrate-binding protein [Clostridiales bacterium]